MLRKYAIRFILFGGSRTYIVQDEHTIDAIIHALDRLECDEPEMVDAPGLCLVAKTWPEGAHLALEGDGPVIDTTRPMLRAIEPEPELEAA